MSVQGVPQEEDFGGEAGESPESGEAAFYYFLHDFNYFATHKEYGQKIWENINEETRASIKAQMKGVCNARSVRP